MFGICPNRASIMIGAQNRREGMNKPILMLMAALSLCTALSNASGNETRPISLTAECTTKGTDWDGSRNACHSKAQCQKVPSGYVVVKDSITRKCRSCNGSESSLERSCRYSFGDPVEVVPNTGIYQPTKVCVSAHARSPRHHHGARGWAKCEFSGKYVKYN